jgi:hypothetical protein
MKKSLFLPALIAVVSVLTGCYDDPALYCPTGCTDVYGNCAPCVVVAPPPGGGQPILPPWNQVPGQGIIFTHLNSGVVMGTNTMITEIGTVFVHISSTVYNRDAGIFYHPRTGHNLGMPVLVEFEAAIWPVTMQPYLSAVRLSVCALCY